MQVCPHQRPHLGFTLTRVEQHLVSEPTLFDRYEQSLQFILRERARHADAFAAHFDHVELRKWIRQQPLRLDQPVQKSTGRDLILFFRFRRTRETRAPFGEQAGPNVAETNRQAFSAIIRRNLVIVSCTCFDFVRSRISGKTDILDGGRIYRFSGRCVSSGVLARHVWPTRKPFRFADERCPSTVRIGCDNGPKVHCFQRRNDSRLNA